MAIRTVGAVDDLRSCALLVPRLRALLDRRKAIGVDRELPGREVAPGLRLIEERIAIPQRSLAGAAGGRPLLFLDTETTGLAGGTGTLAFMIGAARWTGGALELRQWLLTRISGECHMLEALAGWLAPDDQLATYNGKCFDRPLLSTRFRLQRLPDSLARREHHDLLHAVRRGYRGRWENCRLLTAERELLGVVRHDDLPGAQAPAAWRTFLRGGNTTDLNRVATHNRQDLISLARLADLLLPS
jgi:hypothetical protein